MKRRAFLAAAGLAATAGCLGGTPGSGSTTSPASGGTRTTVPGPRVGDDLPADPDPTDGYPPAFETTPPEPGVDPAGFETVDVDGVAVPLAPVDVAYAWYARGTARFADARGGGQYRRSHVFGAVWSPVEGIDSDADDPVPGWPADDRVVCYCGCPHHLSSMRAAALLRSGFGSVYVVDEGFWEWHDRGYPMAGDDVGRAPAAWALSGLADPTDAGGYATAVHEPSGQAEAARIDADGRYRLELRFAGVTADSPVVVTTPTYEVVGPLGRLADGLITGAG